MAKLRMAKTKTDTSHYFVDGHSSRRGLLGVVAFPNRLRGTDTEFTTLYFTEGDEWSHETFDFDGRSLTYLGSPESGNWWLLGKRGEVARLGDDVSIEQIPLAGTGPRNYGYLNAIRSIAGSLYVCGFRRQVLVRDGLRWSAIDAGLREDLSAQGSSLESIDGVDASCVYTVGSGGQIWHYNGTSWRQCASPTNADLHEVRCHSPSEIAIVGQNGTVLIGSMDSWDIYQSEDLDEDLWGVEYYGESIYVSGFSGIGQIVGKGLVPVDTKLGRPILGYRLRVRDGILWSIGNDDILCFDGSTWSERLCPDNKP